MASRRDNAPSNKVVWISHRDDASCSKCGKEIGRGRLVQVNERDGVRCVSCAGYADLCFLPAGDASLTRLATGLSERVVVVLRWSRTRKRHERQGILVEEHAYDVAIEKVKADSSAPGPHKFRVLDIDGDSVVWKD